MVLGWALTASTSRAQDNAAYQDNLNGGYYLLHKLYADESQVPILLDLKTAPKEIQDFADKNPLPKIEQEVRASITDEKQHQLLFGTKGPDFVRAFLVSQAEATKYAANIDKVLAGQDKNPEHERDLRRMSAQWSALGDEVFRLMRNY